jgi:hypothetical protein
MEINIMRVSFILSMLILAACGVKKSSYQIGKTTRAEIIAEKGDSIREDETPMKDTIVSVYPDDEKYQFKNDVLVNTFKNPQGDEKQLTFWIHKFKECEPISKTLPHDPAAHTPPEIEMSCPSEGVSIIYTQGSGIVTRVVEYEAK